MLDMILIGIGYQYILSYLSSLTGVLVSFIIKSQWTK